MKCYFKKNLKLGILIFGLFLFLYNCQKKEEIVHQEFQQNGAFSKISFDEFKSKTNLNNEFESFSRFFDINKPASKASFNKKSSGNFDDAIILTDNIIRIKKDDFSTYTFTILTQTKNYEFYNLVLYVDNNQEIYKSHILKYTPSDKWLADTTKHFSGNVKIINNDIFNVDSLLQSKSSLSSKSILLEECIDDVIISYECSNGVKGHREGNPGPEGGCFADDFYVYINILPIPCDGGGDNGDFDPETGGGEGGTTSGGGDDDIVTGTNTVTDAWKIKNFESGTLNTEERNYYNSDPDIKGTIDNYLKLKNFSYTPKQEAKASLKFGESLKLNFEQFKWAFNNRESADFNDITDYLNEAINITPEIEEFIKSAIEALVNGGEVDFINKVIKDTSFVDTKADCVYELLSSTNNNLFKDVLSTFTNGTAKFDLKLKIGAVPVGADGSTSFDKGSGVLTITLPPATNSKSSIEIAAMILHEGIHAELRRIYEGNNLVSEPLSVIQFNYLKSLWDYYRGISPPSKVSNNASHTFMVQNHVLPIANAIREFDRNSYSLDYYMGFAWDGLSAIGKITNPPLLTTVQHNNYINLQQVPLNDSIKQNCDE